MVEADHEVAADDVSITAELNIAPLMYLGTFHLFCMLKELFAAKVCTPIIFRKRQLPLAIISKFAIKTFLIKMYSLLMGSAARSTDRSQNEFVTIRVNILDNLKIS